jgi:hypothetical protein
MAASSALDCSFVKCVSGLIDWRTRRVIIAQAAVDRAAHAVWPLIRDGEVAGIGGIRLPREDPPGHWDGRPIEIRGCQVVKSSMHPDKRTCRSRWYKSVRCCVSTADMRRSLRMQSEAAPKATKHAATTKVVHKRLLTCTPPSIQPPGLVPPAIAYAPPEATGFNAARLILVSVVVAVIVTIIFVVAEYLLVGSWGGP